MNYPAASYGVVIVMPDGRTRGELGPKAIKSSRNSA